VGGPVCAGPRDQASVRAVRTAGIRAVRPANGDAPDFHEFVITPQNTALILTSRLGTADLAALGLSAHQPVNDGVVQEIDIKTGKLLFQ
jgi:hypothetical protein